MPKRDRGGPDDERKFEMTSSDKPRDRECRAFSVYLEGWRPASQGIPDEHGPDPRKPPCRLQSSATAGQDTLATRSDRPGSSARNHGVPTCLSAPAASSSQAWTSTSLPLGWSFTRRRRADRARSGAPKTESNRTGLAPPGNADVRPRGNCVAAAPAHRGSMWTVIRSRSAGAARNFIRQFSVNRARLTLRERETSAAAKPVLPIFSRAGHSITFQQEVFKCSKTSSL